MIASQLSLSKNQVDSFDRFLLTVTSKTLNVLETMFMLNIDRSESSIEIVSAVDCEKIKHLGSVPLYAISSPMAGELQGSLHLLIHSIDFKRLSEVMIPILKLSFLSGIDADLATLENQKPEWMLDDDKTHMDESAFHEQMMDDVLTELANVLFGVNTSAMYMIYDLHTYHILTESLRIPDQQPIQQILSSTELPDQQHMVIENEFSVSGKLIRFWCLISPTQKSFKEILNRVE